MNEPQRQVLNILLWHKGRHRAIKGVGIAHRLGQSDDRQVRLIIRQLITLGYPIASAVTAPVGFFIVETKGEAQAYMQSLRSRLIEDALRRRDFGRSAGLMLDKVVQGKLV